MKNKNLFDHLEGLTSKKTKWEDLTEEDKKTVNPYLLNRFISMNQYYLNKVNNINQFTYDLDPKDIYNYYLNCLPNKKTFFRYIKKSGKNENQELINILTDYYKESSKVVEQYLINLTKDHIIEILRNLSYNEKEIKKLIKNV